MAYNQTIALRIEELIQGNKNFAKKKMFGGIGYLYNGNMCIGVYKDEIIIRYDASETDKLLAQKSVRPFDIAGKPMKGWLLINEDGIKGKDLEN